MKLDLTAAGYVFHNNRILFIHHAKLNMWLPPGGHLEPNETPDDAALREIKEETRIDARIINWQEFPEAALVKSVRQTAIPFFTDVHSVGDHEHYGACYLCECDSDKVVIDKASKNFCWLTEQEIRQNPNLPEHIRAIALEAFKHYERLRN
jgi:8-oxo-dGTP pyrophosphatase MutT (NUDIX family)